MRRRFGCQSLTVLAATMSLVLASGSCGGGGSSNKFPPPTPVPAAVAVSVSPTAVTLVTQQMQTFTATVTGSSNTAVNWQVNQIAGGNASVGTITSGGIYTAPASVPSPAMVTVAAISQADTTKSANATATITNNISVVVSPSSVTLAPKTTQQFTATVTGNNILNNNTAVNWSVNGTPGGNSTAGTISASGLYSAPAVVPSPAMVTVTATSQADSTKSGNATVTIEHDNELPQSTPIKLGTTGGNSTDISQSANKTFCCSGTLGSLVSRGGTEFILSNNHVLDRSGQGTMGQPISQPGLADANCDSGAVTTVAHLSEAAPLKTAPKNVDAALAQVIIGDVDAADSILDLAGVGQPAPPSATLADPATVMAQNGTVAKSGSASGLTCSTINSVLTNVSVDYSTSCQGGTKFTVIFDNQVDINGASFSTSGDSGSLVVTADNARPLGLLFAGATNDTVANPISDVLNAFPDSSNPPNFPTIVGGADHTVVCPAATQSQLGTVSRAQLRQQARSLSDSEVERATIAKSAQAAELLRDPAITGLDVAASSDDPRHAAIVVYTNVAQAHVPHLVDGVRTRVVYEQAADAAPSARAAVGAMPTMTRQELLRGIAVKAQHAKELMANPAIIGVGVGASHDNPSESALVVFIERGKQASVPAEIDGIRTRIQFTDRFRAFGWGKSAPKSCSRK